MSTVNIATLGPTGTCSEHAARYFLKKENLEGEVRLYSTFEESIEVLKNKEADITIIPSAYVNFANIVFKNLDKIKIEKSYVYYTPKLMIAKNRKNLNEEVLLVATHPSPSSLIANYYPYAEIKYTRSNSESAILVNNNEVDACITTESCVSLYNLKVIKDFGEVPMSWNIFRRIGEIE